MSNYFSADFFAGNRARLRKLFTGTAPIVITANGLLQKTGDSAYPFKQDANFWYLTGIDTPDAILVIDKDKEYVIMPDISDYQNIFDVQASYEDITRQSGITTVLNHKEGWKQLTNRLKKVKHLATVAPPPSYIPTYGIYTNPARDNLAQHIKELKPDIELLDLRQHLSVLRMIKQEPELAIIKSAIDLTCEALRKLKTKLPKLNYEYQAEAEITNHFIKSGAIDAWKPIVASGKNACILHSRRNTFSFTANDLVIIDIGAEMNNYCADITRTYSIGGNPSKRQKAVFESVKEVQEFALSLQKPGAKIRDNEKLIEHFMGEKLRELGLIKNINQEAVKHYYPHATSHFLGIEPHDAGDFERSLEPGTVITVEPGIYIPEEGMGVRIEDDIVITETGYKLLSQKLSREL